MGYQVYNQPSTYEMSRPLAQSAVPTEVNKSTPIPQKVIPGSEQELYLIDKFGEKKLKELDILPCETCDSRRYQDDSDDSGVSFQTPQHIAPEASGQMVMAHEQEHVAREGAAAEAEDREVVSQSVTLHSDVCAECGKVYVAGGETRTTTRAKVPNQQADAYVGNLIDLKL